MGVVVERDRNGPHHLRVGGERLHAQYLLEIERCVNERTSLRLSASIFSAVPGVHPGSGVIFSGVMVSGLHR